MKRALSLTVILAALPFGPAALGVLVTGPSDPAASINFQGANALTFTSYGYNLGTGPTDLKAYTNIWTDPTNLYYAQIVPALANNAGTNICTNKMTQTFVATGFNNAAANARDYEVIASIASNSSQNQALDQPWLGNVWDMGGQANKAVVFACIDHPPLPAEALEYTVYMTNTPFSTNLSSWTLATLDSVYMEGWESDSTSLADSYVGVWKMPGNQTFQYVSVEANGSQAFTIPSAIPGGQPQYSGNEDEIDAVAGLTANEQSVVTPEPASLAMLAVGATGLAVRRRGKCGV